MGGQGSINKNRGSAKSPWELKRGCGVAALLRRYCGERLLSGPAFWENGSRASALHMPLDICPQHVIPISKHTHISSSWLLFHARSILSRSVSVSYIHMKPELIQITSSSLSLSISLSLYIYTTWRSHYCILYCIALMLCYVMRCGIFH